MFELSSFGTKFTVVHVIVSLTVYLTGALILEKMLTEQSKSDIMEKAEKYA